jgi:hypothetical protein
MFRVGHCLCPMTEIALELCDKRRQRFRVRSQWLDSMLPIKICCAAAKWSGISQRCRFEHWTGVSGRANGRVHRARAQDEPLQKCQLTGSVCNAWFAAAFELPLNVKQPIYLS